MRARVWSERGEGWVCVGALLPTSHNVFRFAVGLQEFTIAIFHGRIGRSFPLVPRESGTTSTMASARDGDGNNYVPFNKNMVNGLVLNNCPMNWLKDSDPINDRNSDGYGAPDPSFITPGLNDKNGEYVDWADDGPAGYGSVWKSTSASDSLGRVLARSSGEEPASPRHRAGIASMAWRNAP